MKPESSTMQGRAAARNRERLMAELGGGLVVMAGFESAARNGDCDYPFRQDSDFLFLTGHDQPGAMLILHNRASILFVPRPDKKKLLWSGEGPTRAELQDGLGFTRVAFCGEFDSIFRRLGAEQGLCHAPDTLSGRLRGLKTGLRFASAPLGRALKKLRQDKTGEELCLLRRAAEVTARGHILVMSGLRPGLREYQARAIFEKALLDGGLSGPAFPTIAASGQNASVLHYGRNDAVMKAGELLLLDAGGEFHGYASDMTRTFPCGARFSRRQRDIYGIVLAAQSACMGILRPGIMLEEAQKKAEETIAGLLLGLGILKGAVEEILRVKSHKLFFPHGVSHPVGLDVHDVYTPANGFKKRSPLLRADIRLSPGRVVTVEPGVYFSRALLGSPAVKRKHGRTVAWDRVGEYMGVGGVRIEDTVVIGENGCEVLGHAPKSVSDIESIRSHALKRGLPGDGAVSGSRL